MERPGTASTGETIQQMSYFQRGSSQVDWCEDNYQYSPHIAEFFNTISNLPFIVFPPLLMTLFRSYAIYISADLNIVWLLMIVVGLGSSYFHATLSLSGQIIDELSILWVVLAAFSVAIPNSKLLGFSRNTLRYTLLFLGFVGTLIAFLQPVINAILLQGLALPCLFLLIENLRRTRNWTVIRLLAASVCWWILAITCWINDKFFCLIWKSITSIPYPQFHSWWHVFIVLASYTAIVVVAYFRALEECAERRPRIRYWPDTRWAWELGVPYVRIDDHVNAKAE